MNLTKSYGISQNFFRTLPGGFTNNFYLGPCFLLKGGTHTTLVGWVFDFVNNHQFGFLNVSELQDPLVPIL
jgi:hypothetical protein